MDLFIPHDTLREMLSDSFVPLSKKLELLDGQEALHRHFANELRALAERWKTEEGDDNEIGGGYY